MIKITFLGTGTSQGIPVIGSDHPVSFSKDLKDKRLRSSILIEYKNLHFTIKADRFLRNMVRAIVGTLIDVGLEKLRRDDIVKIIAAKDRSESGSSVPAHALFLVDIKYPNKIRI